MSENGGIIGPDNIPTASVASGVWSLAEAFDAQTAGDPYWDNVSVLIQPTADAGASDVGPTGHTVTEVGNANVTDAESRFDGFGIALDGTGDWLTLPAHANFDFGTGDFTIEMFVMFDATTNYQVPITSRQYYTAGKNGNWVLRTHTSLSNLVFASYDGTSSVTVITGTYTFSTATWYHIAISRVSSTLSIYVDGVSKGSGTESRNLLDGGDGGIAFGENIGGNSAFNGHIDGVRVTKGVGRYTGNFDVPTAAFPTKQGRAAAWPSPP